MTELYREAAELLGLEVDGNHVIFDRNIIAADGRMWFQSPALPIYLAHLICEKEGWTVEKLADNAFEIIDGKTGNNIKDVIYNAYSDTPNAVIRAFVEKYGKKKTSDNLSYDEVRHAEDDDWRTFIVKCYKEIKSLSERMDKMEGK